MKIKDQLEKDLREAMLAKDELRKSTLRLALSAVKLAEVEPNATLMDEDLVKILQKEVKSRRETIKDAHRAGRQDLADAAEAEIAILLPYLPQPLTEGELRRLAEAAIESAGAQSLADMGRVMKVLLPQVQGRAEGGQVSTIVRQLLSS